MEAGPTWRRAGDVFAVFLRLGLTSFGGPIAHLGYFRTEFVTRLAWLSDQAYADLIALCQFLPGPASSQAGFAIGLMRAGPLGALAAFVGFTLPSAVLMFAFAYGASSLSGPLGVGLIHGLKLVAVAVVAQAVLGMARTLAPDRLRAAFALAALVVATAGLGQILAIALGALGGVLLFKPEAAARSEAMALPMSHRAGLVSLGLFLLLLIVLPLLGHGSGAGSWQVAGVFYRVGALVFGGGHVVLPLLQTALVTPGWVAEGQFLAGYGAAQALPGPLFSLAAYLGALMPPTGPHGLWGASLALVFLFLPGLLLVVAALPFWSRLRHTPRLHASMAGANAAVVGVLAAALYSPIWTSAVFTPSDFALAALGFIALVQFRVAPVWVVLGGGLLGVGLSRF